MSKIRKEYIPNPDFDPQKVRTASSAAEGLCKWVQAMEIYDRVAKVTLFSIVDLHEIILVKQPLLSLPILQFIGRLDSQWVCDLWYLLFKVVAPKKARLAEAEESLAETMKILNAKREELAEVEGKLANLKLTFAEMTEKKQQLEFQVWLVLYIILSSVQSNV